MTQYAQSSGGGGGAAGTPSTVGQGMTPTGYRAGVLRYEMAALRRAGSPLASTARGRYVA